MTAYVKTQNKGTLNLRQMPNASSPVLAQIPYGAKLEVEVADNKWYKTTYNGKSGYVMAQYLSTETSDTKADLQKIYNSLKETLALIEKALK